MKKASIEINPRDSIVTKKSMNIQKIEDQYQWYINLVKLNPQLKNIIPQVYKYTKSTRSSKIEMEYVAANNLAKYYTDESWDYEQWKSILKTLLKTLKHFTTYQAIRYDDLSSRKSIYFNATQDAFAKVKEIPFVQKMMKNASLIINGQPFTNLLLLEPKVISTIKQNFLLGKDKSTLAHGNFSLSNILYINNDSFKLVDPLGRFHKQTIYGDINYDLAKLSQSISGKLDFIDHQKFSLNQDGAKFDFKINIKNVENYQKIETYFLKMAIHNFNIKLKELQMIEGLCFLQQIPYYENDSDIQKALYLMAIMKINQYFANTNLKLFLFPF